jgi:hypothetical protein
MNLLLSLKILRIKKKIETPDFSSHSPGYWYNSWLIHIAILLVTQACLSVRAVHKVFQIFSLVMPIITRIPSRSTIRLWILKFGLHKLMKPKEILNDWAVILDHTIQMGKLKILIVLGISLSRLPVNRSLTLADMQILHLLPMQSSTGPKIQEVLINLKSELGIIREVVADEGSDIKSGINLYRINNPECDYINDIVHKLAHFLQAELKNNEAWEKLLKKASEARTRLLQTDYAEFVPPQRRDKARYLNLEKFIKWAIRILIALFGNKLPIEERKKIFKEFSWVIDLVDDIEYFHQLWQITSISRDFIRNYGIQSNTAEILSRKLQCINLDFKAQLFADKIIQFISELSKKAKPNERLLGSSEIIESLIGLVKYHSNTQSRSGFTSSILMAAALTGEVNEQIVLNSMTNIKMADLEKWEITHFDTTVQKKQAKFYRQTPLQEYVNLAKNGTENGTFFTVDFEQETG